MKQKNLSGINVIVTGGPTREWLDPVRFISNPSSGKMGAALADAAHQAGADVLFIHGPVHPEIYADRPYRCISVDTTIEMHDAVMKALTACSVLIMAAAPADYRPVKISEKKIKKSNDVITLELIKTVDILKAVSMRRIEQKLEPLFVAGFAAETHDVELYAQNKLKDKNLDMICVNDVSIPGAGFGTMTNIITIFTPAGERVDIPLTEKSRAAEVIIKFIIQRIDFN